MKFVLLLALVQSQLPPAQFQLLKLDHSVKPPESSAGVIGNVTSLAVAKDGSVFTAEETPARVLQYDRTGSFIRTVMRSGEGPGETRAPRIVIHSDTLYVLDPVLGRLSRLTLNGKIVDERRFPVRSLASMFWVADDGSVVVTSFFAPAPWDGIALRLRKQGKVDTTLWKYPRSEDRMLVFAGPTFVLKGRFPFSPPGEIAFDLAGRLILGGTKRSSWVIIDGRDTVGHFSSPDVPIPIAPHVRDSVWDAVYARLKAKAGGLPHFDEVVRKDAFPTTLPAWMTINVDPAGRWWIGRSNSRGQLGSWDIVERGRITKRVTVPASVTTGFNGEIFAFGQGTIALLHADQDGIPWIGVYRVP